MTRAQAAADFDREQAAAAESLALEFGIQDAGGWHTYQQLRDGTTRTTISEERKSA